MKNLSRASVTLAMLYVLASNLEPTSDPKLDVDMGKVEVFYSQFENTKFYSITRDSIRKEYNITSLVQDQVSALEAIVSKGGMPATFNDINVCLMLNTGERVYYVDWKYVVDDQINPPLQNGGKRN